MNKFKKILLGALSVLTLGLFVVSTTEVEALTENEHSVTESFVGITSTNVTTNGFKFGRVSGSQTSELKDTSGTSLASGYTYAKLCYYNNSDEYVESPKISSTTNSYNEVVVDVTFALLSSSSTCQFKIEAYDMDSKLLTSKSFTSTNDKNFTFVDYSSLSISAASSIYFIRFCAPTDVKKSVCIDTMTVKYYDYVLEDGDAEISFYSGSSLLAKKIYEKDSIVDYEPTIIPDGQHFEGWYLDSALSSKLDANYVVDGTITKLYAKYEDDYEFFDGTLFSDINAAVTVTESNSYNSIFELSNITLQTNTVSMPNGKTIKRLKTNSAISSSKNYIKFTATKDCKFVIYCAKANDKDVSVIVYSNSVDSSNIEYSQELPTKNEFTSHYIDISAGITYYVGSLGSGIYFYGLYEGYNNATSTELSKQFDDDDNPEYLRFIGKIQGIAPADYANISSVLMEFDFNGHKEAYCYRLYKSVTTLDNTFASGDFTMYTVLTLSNVEKYTGKDMSFENIKMTVTFSDGSTKVATHNDIPLA